MRNWDCLERVLKMNSLWRGHVSHCCGCLSRPFAISNLACRYHTKYVYKCTTPRLISLPTTRKSAKCTISASKINKMELLLEKNAVGAWEAEAVSQCDYCRLNPDACYDNRGGIFLLNPIRMTGQKRQKCIYCCVAIFFSLYVYIGHWILHRVALLLPVKISVWARGETLKRPPFAGNYSHFVR